MGAMTDSEVLGPFNGGGIGKSVCSECFHGSSDDCQVSFDFRAQGKSSAKKIVYSEVFGSFEMM